MSDGFKTFFVCYFGYIHDLKRKSKHTIKIYNPLKKPQVQMVSMNVKLGLSLQVYLIS